MGFGDRKGWDAKVEGREVGKKPASKPAPEAPPAPPPPPEPKSEPPAPEPTPDVVEAVEVLPPPAWPIRYHYAENKLSPGLHVLRIGGELTEASLKRIIDFITIELHAQRY